MDDFDLCGSSQQFAGVNHETDATQGLEDISLSDENDAHSTEEDIEGSGIDEVMGCKFDDETAVNGLDDICKINFKDMSVEGFMRFHFSDVGVAFMFYNWYASMHGFAARKSKIHRNKNGEATQQIFLCYRQGQREDKYGQTLSRKREPKAQVRCGCEAKCVAHIESKSGRWYIKLINDVHNHTLLDDKFMGMLPAHRKMTDYDKFQMTNMRKVGMRTSHIFGWFARQAGGYQNVGFRKRDMYNEQERQRHTGFSDAKAGLDFLNGMRSKDDMMFVRHTVDQDGQLEHLFWCDGVGRRDFSVFGDVLAFDATYRKNKYLCPIVVFSGVNHHNQSIVFASAVVANETEATYVWLLEQFVEAMGGKSPSSVITDGDMAMRNAIRRVFPTAHHRLCAWHLLRNATSNVKNVNFVPKFRQCMLGDYDVGEFNRKWKKMVDDLGLQENTWVRELYEKRKMWATAHIRGNFFAGFRTTSRCEGLHSEFSKYVNLQNNLLEFLQHFFRWLNYMRYREVEADFISSHGEPVLQTQLQALEMSAAQMYTREVFMLFRPVLQRACTCRVVGCRQTTTLFIYTVSKYQREGLEWTVSFCPLSLQFKCSCERLESLGLPCEHLVCVMVYLDIVQMPDCVIYKRWTKSAKDSIGVDGNMSISRDPSLIGQYIGIIERCKRMAAAAIKYGKPEHIRSTIDLVTSQTHMLEALPTSGDTTPRVIDPLFDGTLRNLARARSKGCGGASSSAQGSSKQIGRKRQTCGVCRAEGHNRKSCPVQRQNEYMFQSQVDSNVGAEDDEYSDEEWGDVNVDMTVS